MFSVVGSVLSVEEGGGLALTPGSVIVVDDSGHIVDVFIEKDLPARFKDLKQFDFGDSWILPPFVDAHVHFPQIDIVGHHSGSLLSWLENLTFPTEMRYNDPSVSESAAKAFCRELICNGVAAAAVFSSNSKSATDAIFSAFQVSGLRGIIGRPSMDTMGPPELLIGPEKDLELTRAAIADWHNKENRLFVVLTPRFAPCVSKEIMASYAGLLNEHPSLYVQTHIAETCDEVALVKRLFPFAKSYLDVYDGYRLLGNRTILAHGIYLSEVEKKRISATGSMVCHCPSSNLFLGSGLFGYQDALDYGIKVLLGSDVGAGTSFSPWKTMGEAYKVSKLKGEAITPGKLLYDSTIGAAKALGLASGKGLVKGAPADLQVISPWQIPILARKKEAAVDDLIGAMMYLADDRILRELFVGGVPLLVANAFC